MKRQFYCSQCGECCRHIDRVPLLREYHNGNGICKYLDMSSNICKIYDHRPTICNVAEAYDKIFFRQYTEDEFVKMNYDACMLLQKERSRSFMYLSGLKHEQKESFLDLCIFFMKVDGITDKSEEITLQQYCKEMEINMRVEPKHENLAATLKDLKRISSSADLKKMTIEIVALIYADDCFQKEENEILAVLAEIFEFSPHMMSELVFATRHLLLSYKMLNNIVSEN